MGPLVINIDTTYLHKLVITFYLPVKKVPTMVPKLK